MENGTIKVSNKLRHIDANITLTKDQQVAYDGLLKFIDGAFDGNDFVRALVGYAGTGKALKNGTPVLSNKGWVSIENLKVGDLVATPYHGYTKVKGVYPQGVRHKVYDIYFADNRVITCDENHLWLVRSKKQITNYRLHKGDNLRYSKVVATKELFNDISINGAKYSNGSGYRYSIPVSSVELEEKELPINPYVLGILLGDGCLTSNNNYNSNLYVSSDEEDIISKVANIIGCKYEFHKSYNYTNRLYGDGVLELDKSLRDFNLRCKSVDKYIPEIYLMSSIEQRRELLKGLIDTDGYVDERGRYRFSTSSKQLGEDFQKLCRSLGYIVSSPTKDVRGKNINYNYSIQTNDIIFSSKLRESEYNRCKNKHTFYNDHIQITNIFEKNIDTETTCIAVEDSDKLFITKDYLITHNTFLIRSLIKNCRFSYSVIGLSAPSHKACRVLRNNLVGLSCNINTIQSDFGFKPNYDLEKFDIKNVAFTTTGRIKVEEYNLYIIDEASMINKGLVSYILKVCKSNKCKVIFCGDDHQIPPVNEHECHAFKYVKTYRLNQIVRQDADNPVKELCNILRSDIENHTFNFLNYIGKTRSKFDTSMTKGFIVCGRNEFTKQVYTQFSDEAITKNTDYVKVVAYTNREVSNWNKLIREAIIKDSDKSCITTNDLITSYTTIVDMYNDAIIRNSEDYIVKEIANYTHPKYDIKGFMVKFQAVFGGHVTSPLFVLDHRDAYSLQLYCQIVESLIDAAKNASPNNRAAKWKAYYKFKESCLLLVNIGKPDGTIAYYRDLDYGFALSSHKSQGSTYNVSMVDVNDIVYDKFGNPYPDADDINKRLYVAVSRAKEKVILCYGA